MSKPLHTRSTMASNAILLTMLALITLLGALTPQSVSAQPTVQRTSVLVKDAGRVDVKVDGALVRVTRPGVEYSVTLEFQRDQDRGEEQYRRVILFSRNSNRSNCLTNICWGNVHQLSMLSPPWTLSTRWKSSGFLITSWGHDPNNPNSKGGAPYRTFNSEAISVGNKKGVKLTFESGFGAGKTVITIIPKW